MQKLINLEIQNFIADLFAEIYEGRKEYFVSKDKEVDFIIIKRNKAEIIGEVKWKNITQEDTNKFIKNSERLYGKRVLICKGNGKKYEDIEIIPSKDIISLVKKLKTKIN